MAELKNSSIVRFAQGIGGEDVHADNNPNAISIPGYARFVVEDTFPSKVVSHEKTDSFIKNYLEPIVKQLDSGLDGPPSVRFTSGQDVEKIPGGALHLTMPYNGTSLIVETINEGKLQELNRYLLEHKNEVDKAKKDVLEGKVPEKPVVPVQYRSSVDDNKETLAERLAALSPDQRPAVVAQLASNAVLHQEKLAEQQAQQQRGMEQTA